MAGRNVKGSPENQCFRPCFAISNWVTSGKLLILSLSFLIFAEPVELWGRFNEKVCPKPLAQHGTRRKPSVKDTAVIRVNHPDGVLAWREELSAESGGGG